MIGSENSPFQRQNENDMRANGNYITG